MADIKGLYRQYLGRDPDEQEFASETENEGKYGLGQLESNLKERAASTDHRQYDSQTTNPFEQEMNRRADAAHAGGNQSPTSAWNSRPAAPQGGGNQFMDLLMQRINRPDVSASDPNIKNRVGAFSAQVDRSRRNYLSDTAERNGPLANMQGEQRMAAERMGQQVGGFEAELVGRETEGRRAEIMQTLQLYGSMLSNQDRMALERELAQMQDRSRTLDRDQGMDQFLRELALREWMAGEDNDYRWHLGA